MNAASLVLPCLASAGSIRPRQRSARGEIVTRAAVRLGMILLIATVAFGSAMPHGLAEEDAALVRRATWAVPSWDDVRREAQSWIEAHTGEAVDPVRLERARQLWPDEEPLDDPTTDRLDRFAASMALLDARAAAIVASSERPERVDAAWLLPAETIQDEQMLHAVMALFHGRQLVRHGHFDDGLRLLAGLDVDTACDPASLLFHRATCEHWLLDAEAGLATLDRLLEQADAIPVRYERLALLMRADLAELEDESLDHIARRMRDVTRRLGHGQAGPRTQSVQDGVIESLDKLIAKLEEQQQQQQSESGGAGGGAGGSGGSRPMDDSRLAGGQGPGEVTRKDLENGEEWGNLPPHEREEALQQIAREFPPHYREVIELYFKRLASGDESP
jgi:hypothetical protein